MFEIEYLDIPENEEYEKTINKVLTKCYQEENLQDSKLCVEITLTTPQQIRNYNKKYRNIDKETDVLSFPMFEKEEIDEIISNRSFKIADVLGSIIISIDRVSSQAEEYGHTFERELSYMIVHGFYHLMGYDHMEEDDKEVMRAKEENILNILNVKRR